MAESSVRTFKFLVPGGIAFALAASMSSSVVLAFALPRHDVSKSGMSCFDVTYGIVVRIATRFGLITINDKSLPSINQDSAVVRQNSYHIYYRDNRAGVYTENFKADLIFSPTDELSTLIDFSWKDLYDPDR